MRFVDLKIQNYFGLGVLIVLGLWSCKKRNYNQSSAKEYDISHVKTDGLATISWTCFGKGNTYPPEFNSQEEYCEWTRLPVKFDGEGVKVTSTPTESKVETLKIAKACVFTTAFDQTRIFYLTQRMVGKSNKYSDKSESRPFWSTQFNSYAFLVGGEEPDDRVPRDGIIGHCLAGNSCTDKNCVGTRASDPQICDALHELGDMKCTIDKKFSVSPNVTAKEVPAGRLGDQIVKPQIMLDAVAKGFCWYAKDPNLAAGKINPLEEATLVVCDFDKAKVAKCDDLASNLHVKVTLKINDKQCVGGQNTPAGIGFVMGAKCTIPKDNANVRSQSQQSDTNIIAVLNKGFNPVIVRGVVGEFVSVFFEKGGKKFSAPPGTTPASPVFIHKSELDPNLCVK